MPRRAAAQRAGWPGGLQQPARRAAALHSALLQLCCDRSALRLALLGPCWPAGSALSGLQASSAAQA